MRAIHDPASWHEASVLGADGPAGVGGDVRRQAESLDPGAEGSIIESAIGGEDTWMGALGDIEVGQGLPRGRKVMAVTALYRKG